MSYRRFWENRRTPDSLPTKPRALITNLLSLTPTVISRCPATGRTSIKSGTCPLAKASLSRRQPSNPHRTFTERLMSLSASAPKALKLSVGPRPNNSLRSDKLIRSGDFRLFPPKIPQTPRLSPLRLLRVISSPKSQKTQLSNTCSRLWPEQGNRQRAGSTSPESQCVPAAP